MSVTTSEMIGTLRADLRRVEITLAARIDARVAANDSLLRSEVQRESQEVRDDVAQCRAEVVQRLAQAQEEARRQFDVIFESLRHDIQLIAERIVALDAKVESARHSLNVP